MNLGSICWYSTPESRAANKITVLAVTETVVSVTVYWWIAVAFDTYIHLVTSIVIAPLVLLRSEASIKLGVEMFERWELKIKVELKMSTLILTAVLAAACSGLVAWPLAENWLAAHTGWALFWRAAILGCLALNIGVAVAAAAAGMLTGVVPGAGAGVTVAAVAAAGVVAGVVAGAVAGAGVAAAAVAVAVAVAVAAGAVARAVTGVAVVAVAAAVVTGLAVGTLIRALLIRFWATVTHLFAGARAFSKNWQDLTARTDVFQPPELIPGLHSEHQFRVENLVVEWKFGIVGKLLSIIYMQRLKKRAP